MAQGIYVDPSGEKFAIEWAAPEVVLHRTFSIKSDVWSFGIVLYEIITYGRNPYPSMNNDDVKQQIQQGYCMPRPRGCPEKLYDIMLDCWQMDATHRPTFERLWERLQIFSPTFERLWGRLQTFSPFDEHTDAKISNYDEPA